ncbi:MAG: hypothetical protein COW16_13195 [Sphingomonadales bacterium CG12_big_fil_rev_8_21_14_0_65_65_10]|nr:MAG: hypothetical protein COW16_13195 [Sphingomonadales bacterium CG12_big_fil_rev_8_21_14_0_65_65_10]
MVYADIALREHEQTTTIGTGVQFAAVPHEGDHVEIDGSAYTVCFVTHTPSIYGIGSKIRVTVEPG